MEKNSRIVIIAKDEEVKGYLLREQSCCVTLERYYKGEDGLLRCETIEDYYGVDTSFSKEVQDCITKALKKVPFGRKLYVEETMLEGIIDDESS